jgi:hypothetical protein
MRRRLCWRDWRLPILENRGIETGPSSLSEKLQPVKRRQGTLSSKAACLLVPLLFSAAFTPIARPETTKQLTKLPAHASTSKLTSKAVATKSVAARPLAAKALPSRLKVIATAKPAAKAAPAKWTVTPGQKSGQKAPVFTAKATVGMAAKARPKTTYARTWANPPTRTWRTAQMVPAADRYKEIQEALAAKGYFQNTPDGTWGPDSVDALKRFQTDQKLENDGKLGSLSLLALGLGPKRGSAEALAKPDAQGQQNPSAGIEPVVGASPGQAGEPAGQPIAQPTAAPVP